MNSKRITRTGNPAPTRPGQKSSYILPLTNEEVSEVLDRKITLAVDGFATVFCEKTLRDRSKLSAKNALTISEYIIAMKREINPRLSYIRNTIQFLSQFSRYLRQKPFKDNTKDDIFSYLDSNRKPEDEDPLHKWIGSYNLKRETLIRFFKWLYYPYVDNSAKRTEISISERKPDCIMGIPKLKRKEISCYKPSDLWTQEDDLLFLKWVTNKRDRCYHAISRDLSARPHEILGLRLKDVAFKNANGYQYAEVLVNGKTGSRSIPLIQSIPYVKDWISNHPRHNNPNAPLIVSMSPRNIGKLLSITGLYSIYKYYKVEFLPKLIEDPTVPLEDKQKIKELLTKPFNPYIRRHSALTEKSTKLKLHTLNQHAGWSINSNMAKRYIHYFGNESTENLLEAYGIIKGDKKIDTLNSKICPNCGEQNAPDNSKFCAKCRMVLTYDAYSETIEEKQQKESEVKELKQRYEQDMKIMRNEIREEMKEQIAKIVTQLKPEVIREGLS